VSLVLHPAARGRITLLTDFGTVDGYAAAMRGVIASVAPDVIVDDASHDIAHGDVESAAWAFARYWRLYPRGTVHVIVVDPGVGTERRALAIEVAGRYIVAPDNGCASHALVGQPDARIHEIRNTDLMRTPVSRTFHGRDIFAPVAAHLARGLDVTEVGPPFALAKHLHLPVPRSDGVAVHGIVIHIDRFGNLITNLPGSWVPETIGEIEIDGGQRLPVRETYGSVGTGELLALVGSAGFIEVAIRDGSAAAVLSLGKGATVSGRLIR
jgi:S-adenosyl-L-methionine hydrolase (adenosine-forming)